MSYILEALNKSEQERRANQTPDLNTIHRLPPDHQPNKSSKAWIIVAVIFLLLNFTSLWYWLNGSSSETTSAQPTVISNDVSNLAAKNQSASQTTTTANDTTPADHAVKLQEANNNQVQQQPDSSVREQGTLITPQDIFRRAPEPKPEPIRITELPINVQRQIPDMVFSSHLYADDAAFRMVNINGRMYHEGEMISDGVKLLEITDQGVVLSYLHYVFTVSVLQDWRFD